MQPWQRSDTTSRIVYPNDSKIPLTFTLTGKMKFGLKELASGHVIASSWYQSPLVSHFFGCLWVQNHPRRTLQFRQDYSAARPRTAPQWACLRRTSGSEGFGRLFKTVLSFMQGCKLCLLSCKSLYAEFKSLARLHGLQWDCRPQHPQGRGTADICRLQNY